MIYARISRIMEDINNQINNIRDWGAKHGYTVIGVFKDENISGATDPFKRESFVSMIKFCKDNNVDTILILDPSRLGRSLVSSVQALKRLADEGFTVIFTKYNLVADLKTIQGKAVLYSLLMASEFERDFVIMRLESAKASGKHIGRKPKKMKMSDREIKKMFLEKRVSASALARLNDVSTKTMIKYLKKLVGEEAYYKRIHG